jgi:hypothetical protein
VAELVDAQVSKTCDRKIMWVRFPPCPPKNMTKLDINELNRFLLGANVNGYASDGNEYLPPQRPGFNEIEYQKGDWLFHDSYSGHFFAPGQEVVYYKSKPVWAMAYSGGMKEKFHSDELFTKNTIVFLKKALLEMDPKKPFRGPERYQYADWKYISKVKGNVKDFIGNEKIYYQDELVFEQNFIGGVII